MATFPMGALDWFQIGSRGRVLHSIALSPELETELEDFGSVMPSPGVVSACGRPIDYATIPGLFSRMGAKRCDRCCDHLGYPRGIGSPKNDPAIRSLLGLDGAA